MRTLFSFSVAVLFVAVVVVLLQFRGHLIDGSLAGAPRGDVTLQTVAAKKIDDAQADREISFNRDIRPILSDKCFSCHGPDKHDAKADVQLHTQELAVDGFLIVAGDPEASEVWLRINNEKDPMPPVNSHLSLSNEEKTLIKRWIEQGAEYQAHWSYIPARRPELPEVLDKTWTRNAIDYFVLRELEANGMEPSEVASDEMLLRRLTLDLTGLPPTVEQVKAFLADDSDDAYEKAVDRLLASPHFGERVALPWLDIARYADTNGFSIDDHRDMWLWREWVIDAFNRNMPYDQFIVHQMAGDLLPNSTPQQKLATGFLRNSMNTHEGGTIPEEYRVIYIADKIDTVSTAFMGLTMRCAQCHDHKYDPLSQKEFYEMYAFFDTAHEPGMGAHNGNTKPVIRVDGPITSAEQFVSDVEQRKATLQRYLIHPPELVEPRAEWEASAIKTAEGDLLAALQIAAEKRTDQDWQKINEAFSKTTELFDRHVSTIKRELAVLEADLKAGQSSVMVMKEQGPRQTYVLTRGEYDKPDKEQPVYPAVPAVLPPIERESEGEQPATRLDLAYWLVQPDNPLTARVAVNRFWQMLFGEGLVTTPNDFGSQGAYPTHPELLDWLAVEFVESGWDTKHLIKQIVMSATYRQTSATSRSEFLQDPYNKLLSRGARFRLPAEFVRDGALAIAGELDLRIGGPSVYPSQPHGLWREVSHFGYGNAFSAQAFYPSDDDGQDRRSMYTFWKRTSPPPSLSAFDAPTREVCTVQRSRTNTPLQALVLLNDPEYFEAAQGLARLAMEQGGDSVEQRVDYMFRRATARLPEADERQLLVQQYNKALKKYTADPDAAKAASRQGSAEHAAWTVVASVVLNLDEVITRE